ncbi:MAG TPA: ABC transporter permease [Bryobacteraceae bacterium]
MRTTPSVELAATNNIVPISGSDWNDIIEIPGLRSHDRMIPWFNRVSGGYFRTLGTPLLAGRDFDQHDTVSSAEVALVNQEFSCKFLAGANPVGRQIRLIVGPGDPEHLYQITGLVKNSKYQSLRVEFKPLVFVAESQSKEPTQRISVMVPSRAPVGALNAALKQAAARANPEMSIAFQVFQTQVRNRYCATG